jgi:cytoskeleton protein RodZ
MVMRAIEADEIDHLAPLYRRGYLSAYARFLGFEQDDIEQMLGEVDPEHPQLRTVFPEAGRPDQADRWLKATSYVLASLLVGTLAWQFTHEAVRISQSGSERVVTAGENQDGDSTAGLNSSTREIKGATHVNASIAALEILREQRAARTGAGDDAWAALKVQAADSDLPLDDNEFLLQLNASGDSWVEISDASGRQLELDLVRGGTSKTYRGEAPFYIQFGRASSLRLFMDGQPVDLAPFTAGDVTQMLLDGSHNGTAVGAEQASGG